MFADGSQFDGFLELFGAAGHLKPFECVGEPDECRVALELLRKHADWADHPFLAQTGLEAYRSSDADIDAVFAFREEGHFLTPLLEATARAV